MIKAKRTGQCKDYITMQRKDKIKRTIKKIKIKK